MVCPLNGGCMEVVTSKYSKMFGVNNEVIGALYYAAMAVGALLLFVQPPLAATAFPWLLLGAAALSFLASLYLITIQLFVLKHVCTWCMTTAVINGTLLVLTLQL